MQEDKTENCLKENGYRQLLKRAAGPGCKVEKNVNEKELGILHRMGLVRFSLRPGARLLADRHEPC